MYSRCVVGGVGWWGCTQSVSKVFQVSFKKIFKVFQEVSCCMALIAAIPEQKEGSL